MRDVYGSNIVTASGRMQEGTGRTQAVFQGKMGERRGGTTAGVLQIGLHGGSAKLPSVSIIAFRADRSVLLQRDSPRRVRASMSATNSPDWTTAHDLAVVYIALAYGTDHELTDEELRVVTQALQAWEDREEPDVQEVIVEAAALFVEGDPEAEVRRALTDLRAELSLRERRNTVRHLIRIAEADGVLLEREQGFIHTLADAWSLKQLSEELLENTSAVVQRRGEDWGLIHELAFLYIIVGHSAGDELSPQTVDVMQDRLQEWQPSLDAEEVREVVRRALQVYADDPEEALIHDSVEALKEALPSTQRLTVLDDLHTVARADSPLTRTERELIASLAQAWDVNIRMNGHG